MPCCQLGTNNVKFFSYTGATYGGPVFSRKHYKIKYLKIIIDKIFEYYDNKIEFRLASDTYFQESSFIIHYLLSRKLQLKPELSWYINTCDDFMTRITNKKNKKNLNKLIKNENINCICADSNQDYIEYYEILEKMLAIRHDSKPTHTLDELLLVREILKDKQKLYLVKVNNVIQGGVYVIKVTGRCWYTFYISRNIECSDSAMYVIYILYNIANDARKEGVKYVDYGICTEDKGIYVNEGLATFKEESLGGTSNYRYLFLS